MEAVIPRPIAEPRGSGRPTAEFVAVGVVVSVSWLPVAVGILGRAALGWIAAGAVAAAVAWATARFAPRVLVAAMIASSALVPSGLVTDSTHYLPVAVTAGAIAVRVAFEWWRVKKLSRPLAEPLALAVAIYIGWAALSTIFSIDRRTSAAYWVGMLAVCALVFWVIPLIVGTRHDREFLLAVLGALGVLVAGTVYVLSAIGAIFIFGRRISDYQLIDLTIMGHPSGIYFGKSAGLFGAPLEPSVMMVMAILALLGWTAARTGRWMWIGRTAILVIFPAVLITLDRSAWLAAIISTGVFAALPSARRSAAVLSAVLCLVFSLFFVGVLANGIGANVVQPNQCSKDCPTTAVPGSDEAPLRGGTGLSGRDYLWKASYEAIKRRPIFGYGPGNNVPAITPYLTGNAAVLFKGLTSHSTWFRTAVEEGVPGLIILIGVLLTAAWVFLRGPRELREPNDRRSGVPDPTRVTLAVSMLGMLGVMTFESFFLGGVNFTNLYLAVAVSLMLPPMTLAQLRQSGRLRIL